MVPIKLEEVLLLNIVLLLLNLVFYLFSRLYRVLTLSLMFYLYRNLINSGRLD